MTPQSFGADQNRALLRISTWILAGACGFVTLVTSSQIGPKSGSAEKAARVDAIFQSLKENSPMGKRPPQNSTIRITEDELNAYLEQEYRKKPHSGMKSASVKLFDGNRIAADSIIDVDEIRSDNSMGLKMLTWLMSGNQLLHAEAKLIFRDNTVTYQLERARVNDVTLPNALVEKLIEILARKQSQRIDVTKPISLSASIKHVEIQQALLIIQT
ncbi:MAG: hypothetical protein ACHQKY_02560 [Terriglobia bacterium]